MLIRDSGPRPAAGLAAQLLQALAREALAACDPAAAVRRAAHARPELLSICGRPISMTRKGRLYLLAFGKAAPAMTIGFVQRFKEAGGKRILEALVVHPPAERPEKGRRTVSNPPPFLTASLADLRLPASRLRLKTVPGEHPVPLKDSFAAGKAAMRFAARATAADDVVFLASGGGSALMTAPLPPLLREIDKTNLHRVLLTCGAPIGSINTVRKHLSAVKGGRLAILARRAATQSTLVMCDVDPERYEEVASGPSLPDRTTLDDMIRAIDRYGIAPAIPVKVLEGMHRGRMPETPKPRDRVFKRSRSEAILSNRDLRNAAVRGGLTRGLPAEAMPTDITGPAETAVEMIARAIETAPPGARRGGPDRPAGPGTGGARAGARPAAGAPDGRPRLPPLGLPGDRQRRHRRELPRRRRLRRPDDARTGPPGASRPAAHPARGHDLQVLQASQRRLHHRSDRHERARPLPSPDRPGDRDAQDDRPPARADPLVQPRSARSAAVAARIRNDTQPLTVKNAWFTRLRSPGLTSRCS